MILTILQTVLGLILLLCLGFLCSKVGLIDEVAEKKLTGLLLKVVQPVYLFVAYQRAFALVLGAQLIMGVLFGIIGLFLADPLMAMIKVALERRSEHNEEAEQRQIAAETHGP